MPLKSFPGKILLTGGTGKVSSRLAPLLSADGYTTLLASRSGITPSDPSFKSVKFDWLDPGTYAELFRHGPISAVFLVAPSIMDCFPLLKAFIDIAVQNKVKRFVLLSASLIEAGDGPIMGQVAKYIISVGVEYAILRPTWFMEDFSEMQHAVTIRDEARIMTAAGNGRIPFVSADDIAAVAFRTLTDELTHDTEYLILGPKLWSYDEVAQLLTEKLGRKITHVKLTEEELAADMAQFMASDYANLLAQLDTAVSNGADERMNDVVEKVIGRKPIGFGVYVDGCVARGVWDMK